MTTDLSICNTSNLNDAVQSSQQNLKTVECRLRSTYRKIAETEGNIYLFSRLKSMGLATNDVYNFIQKQTIHKRASSNLDLKVLSE